MRDDFRVIRISTEQCMDLRTRILRPGQDIKHCQYNEDNNPTTFHLGVIDGDIHKNNKIICNGTFMQMDHVLFPNTQNAYRLRGMATDKNYQGKGLGTLLLQESFKILKTRGCDLLWCNAREKAFLFYERSGFKTIGDMFDIPGAGPHKVMWRNI